MRHLIQAIMPQKFLSKFAGMLAESEVVWLKNILIKYFLSRFSLNMAEAIESDPYAYSSYNAFFTRRLKAEARQIASADNILVSPADGAIAQLGYLQKDVILTVKGKTFTLPELLGSESINSSIFHDGAFATIYLAPPDYHRVHMPVTGKLRQMLYVPGQLFSVNKASSTAIYNLFGRNERVVNLFDTEYGKVVVILVGAMLVGSIGTTWAGVVNVGHDNKQKINNYAATDMQQILLNKGEEMGYFKMGSTAIVLLEKGRGIWNTELAVDSKVRVGQALGQLLK